MVLALGVRLGTKRGGRGGPNHRGALLPLLPSRPEGMAGAGVLRAEGASAVMAYKGLGFPPTLQVGDNALQTVVPKRTISKSRNAPPCLLICW